MVDGEYRVSQPTLNWKTNTGGSFRMLSRLLASCVTIFGFVDEVREDAESYVYMQRQLPVAQPYSGVKIVSGKSRTVRLDSGEKARTYMSFTALAAGVILHSQLLWLCKSINM